MVLRAFLRLIGNVFRALLFPVYLIARARPLPRGWLRVRVRPELAELPVTAPPLLRFALAGRRPPTSLTALRRFAGLAGNDPGVEGVVFEVPRLLSGWAAAGALREVIARLRSAGKATVVYLPEGGSHRELWVAAAAGRVLVGRESIFAPLGLGVEAQFLKPLLDRVGLSFEAVARKEYKGAAERFTRSSLSEANREQLRALLEDRATLLEGALGERGDEAPKLLERGLARAAETVEVGFADAEAHVDEVPTALDPAGPAAAGPPRLAGAGGYLRQREARLFRPLVDPPFLAVVPLRGVILDRPVGGPLMGNAVTFDVTARLLRRLRKDPRVVGVLLEIDSPGGSAFASERLHREILRLREEKPVVAWFGDVAASGGYYLAMAAEHVVASETVVTGSIGVISGKWVAAGLLDAVGVATDRVKLHEEADFFSPTRPLGDGGQAILDRQADAFYDRFQEVVAAGRGLSRDQVEAVARGRIWSGPAALRHDLVDALGGFEDALEVLRARARVPEGMRNRLRPRRPSPRELLAIARGEVPPAPPPEAGVLAGLARTPGVGPLLRRLPPEWLEAALLLEDGAPVLAWLPGTPRLD